jgi:hypothetical protein
MRIEFAVSPSNGLAFIGQQQPLLGGAHSASTLAEADASTKRMKSEIAKNNIQPSPIYSAGRRRSFRD